MADYEPLDISAHYNTDAGVLGEDSGFEPGAVRTCAGCRSRWGTAIIPLPIA